MQFNTLFKVRRDFISRIYEHTRDKRTSKIWKYSVLTYRNYLTIESNLPERFFSREPPPATSQVCRKVNNECFSDKISSDRFSLSPIRAWITRPSEFFVFSISPILSQKKVFQISRMYFLEICTLISRASSPVVFVIFHFFKKRTFIL